MWRGGEVGGNGVPWAGGAGGTPPWPVGRSQIPPQHMAKFSMTGTLMGTLGHLCMSRSLEVSEGASEALHYLFKVLVLQRSE